jgi:signal transduction histidine kinase
MGGVKKLFWDVRKWTLGEYGANRLEHHFFLTMSLIGFLIFFISAIVNLFVIGLHQLLSIFSLVSSLFYLVVFLYGRNHKYIRKPFTLLVIVTLPLFGVMFFMNGGSTGPVSMIFLIAIAFILFVQQKKYRKLFMAAVIVCFALMAGFEYFYPDLVIPYMSREQVIIDEFYTATVCALIMFYIANYVRKHYDKERQAALAAEKLKNSFLTNMSHEIRTPLNAIVGFSQVLAEEEISADETKDYAQQVNNNGKLLLTLIEDVLEMTDIEAGEIELKPDKLSLYDLINDLQIKYGRSAKLRGDNPIYFAVNNDDRAKDIILNTDIFRLKQALGNVLGNSIKFTNKGSIVFGYVELKKEQMIEFHILDTGIGIPTEEIDFVFDKFRKRELRIDKHYLGAGLGLPISKYLVEMLGGSVSIESEEKVGTDVRIRIPITIPKEALIYNTQKTN